MKVRITLEVEHPQDVYTDVEYVVSMRWDKAPDTGWGWWLEGIEPAPPNEYVEERIMELAVRELWDEEVAMREAAGR